MGVPIVITMTHERPPDVVVRGWRAIMKGAHSDQGQAWLRSMLGTHFQPGASFKYGYRRRTARYEQRKKRTPGVGSTPLVFSGNFRRAVLEHHVLQGFPTRVRISFNAPVYAPARQRTLRQPPIADEALRVTDQEKRALTEIFRKSIERRIEAYRATRKDKFG